MSKGLIKLEKQSLLSRQISGCVCVCVCTCACLVTQLCLTLCDPWTIAHLAPLSMEFSREGYWRGLPRPPPGNCPDPGIKPMPLASPALEGRFFATEPNDKHFSGLLPDTKHFTFINSFNLCNNLMKWLILFFPFNRKGN